MMREADDADDVDDAADDAAYDAERMNGDCRGGDEHEAVRMRGRAAVILLVEDDEPHAMLIMRVLQDERVANRVFWVKDGAEALDFLYHRGRYAAEEVAPRPDLILLDLRLPRINGHEVLLEIKRSEELRVIPVIVLTTSESEADMMRAYLAYANSYLVKPLDFEKFRRMIANIGFYWLVWNRHPWLQDGRG